jgi:protein deglycase
MAKVYEFLANGFEEIEGLAPVDILRRGGVDIKTVSVTGTEWVETSHGVTIKADLKFMWRMLIMSFLPATSISM